MENISKLFDGSINKCYNYVYSANASNDVYSLREVLKQNDIKEYVAAMVKEIHDHESQDHWELFQRKDLPKNAKTILSVWAFKLKRYPDGRVMKYKGCLNAHGGMQRWGVDYWETYAPVVNSISVRLLIALLVIHKLETKSIDFVLSFPQADIDRDVYMELPCDLNLEEKENLY